MYGSLKPLHEAYKPRTLLHMDDQKNQFAVNISMGMTQAAAARAAGFGAHSGTRLMKDPETRALIAEQSAQIQSQLILSRNDVLEGMLSAIDDAKLVGEAMPQIAGWREVGRIIGCYAPEKKELVIEQNVEVIQTRVRELADEELHKYALIEGEVVQEIDEGELVPLLEAQGASS